MVRVVESVVVEWARMVSDRKGLMQPTKEVVAEGSNIHAQNVNAELDQIYSLIPCCSHGGGGDTSKIWTLGRRHIVRFNRVDLAQRP
jgi:hypothetical protein